MFRLQLLQQMLSHFIVFTNFIMSAHTLLCLEELHQREFNQWEINVIIRNRERQHFRDSWADSVVSEGKQFWYCCKGEKSPQGLFRLHLEGPGSANHHPSSLWCITSPEVWSNHLKMHCLTRPWLQSITSAMGECKGKSFIPLISCFYTKSSIIGMAQVQNSPEEDWKASF